MRFLRAVRLSILMARFSLSAVSSSTEELAVLASAPSFLRRSITSWLERFRSLASWKTLTLPIRLTLLVRPFARYGGHHRDRLSLGGRSGRAACGLFRGRPRLRRGLLRCGLLRREGGLVGHALRLDARV